ncbi:hypothetical protein GCM10022212_16660 [Actimicrobium antarcticum]|uniref:Uncharacterized protein n=1 Tax=Actimicrobium antarcticum TaxID=1051899 RepID=A0ABP7T464_9BURK
MRGIACIESDGMLQSLSAAWTFLEIIVCRVGKNVTGVDIGALFGTQQSRSDESSGTKLPRKFLVNVVFVRQIFKFHA